MLSGPTTKRIRWAVEQSRRDRIQRRCLAGELSAARGAFAGLLPRGLRTLFGFVLFTAYPFLGPALYRRFP